MSKVIKIILMFILMLILSASSCFAIDESELYPNTIANSVSEKNSVNETLNNTSENTSTNTNNTNEDNSIQQNITEETNSQLVVTPTPYEDDSSTTISGVSSISDGSTFTSILNIALIVVGVLLIFLAIAILIRLKS